MHNDAVKSERITTGELRRRLLDQVRGAIGSANGCCDMAPLCRAKSNADDPTKAVVRARDGRPMAVLLCSQHEAPGLVARGVSAAACARASLPGDLGDVILEPLLSGALDGRSYVLLPWRDPLSLRRFRRAVQRSRLAPQVMAWLRGVARVTIGKRDRAVTESAYHAALTSFESDLELDEFARARAAFAIERLSAGEWQPRHVFDHNDLWIDNLLLAHPSGSDGGTFGFVLIDWAGANIDGFGMYDLIRAARSMKRRRSSLRAEIRRHCQALGCDEIDGPGHLLASLGHLGTHIEHFPRNRYCALVRTCWERFRDAAAH